MATVSVPGVRGVKVPADPNPPQATSHKPSVAMAATTHSDPASLPAFTSTALYPWVYQP